MLAHKISQYEANVPEVFQKFLIKVSDIYSHNARYASNLNFQVSRVGSNNRKHTFQLAKTKTWECVMTVSQGRLRRRNTPAHCHSSFGEPVHWMTEALIGGLVSSWSLPANQRQLFLTRIIKKAEISLADLLRFPRLRDSFSPELQVYVWYILLMYQCWKSCAFGDLCFRQNVTRASTSDSF